MVYGVVVSFVYLFWSSIMELVMNTYLWSRVMEIVIYIYFSSRVMELIMYRYYWG